MKRFRFGLESVLQSRRLNENEALRELAEAQKKLQSEFESKRQLQLLLDQAFHDRDGLGKTVAPASGFQLIQSFIVGTKQKILKSDQAIFRANRGVEKAMRSYLQAKRLTRMIETLRERAFSEFKLQVKKFEQKEQDELTIMRNHLLKIEGDAE
jgi:flagellar FliJ protein